MKRRTALRQGLLYAAGIVVMKSVSLITLPVVTTHLTPAEYGTLEILVTLADVGGVLLGLGLVDTLFRFAGESADPQEKRAVCASILALACMVAVGALALTQAAAPWLVRWLPGEAVSVAQLRWLLLSLVVTSCIQIPLAWLRMNARAGAFFCLTTGKTLLQAWLVVTSVQHGDGVTGIVAANAVGDSVLALVLLLWQWRDTGIHWQRQRATATLHYSAPLILSGLALFVLGSFDRWLLAGAVGNHEMALYALACKFALLTALLLRPFEMWWFPQRFAVLNGDDGAQRSARITALGITYGVLVAAGVALGGPWLLRWVTAPAFHDAALYLPWVAAIAAVQAAANLLTVGCYAGRTTLLPMGINIAAAAAALCGYLLLIPRFGVEGAIAATLFAQFLRLSLFHGFSQRCVRLPYPTVRLIVFCSTAGVLVAAAPHAVSLADGAAQLAILGALTAAAFSLRLLPRG
jgi:O-antigen/teichoic acid export membrane protein